MGLENPLHIAILLVILLLLFGAKRLPEMGRGLGEGIRSFRDGISGRGTSTKDEPPAEQPRAELPAAPVAAEPTPDAADGADTPVGHVA